MSSVISYRAGVIIAHLPPTWRTAIEGFADWLITAGRAIGTRKLRCGHIRALAEALPAQRPEDLELDDLVGYLAARQWAAETRRSHRSSLVKFFGWLYVSGRRGDNPAALLPTVAVPQAVPRPAPERVLRAALVAADDRARLMVALAAFGGLRRGEIATTRGDNILEDLSEDDDGYSLRVTGKGGRVRIVPLPDGVAHAVLARGEFWTFPGAIDGHLSPSRVGEIVSALMPDNWSAHTLRHRFASAAYAGDRDIRAVQELLGHASVRTTQIYTAVPNGARRAAVRHASAGYYAA